MEAKELIDKAIKEHGIEKVKKAFCLRQVEINAESNKTKDWFFIFWEGIVGYDKFTKEEMIEEVEGYSDEGIEAMFNSILEAIKKVD